MSVCNILWADDQIDSLCDEKARTLLERYGVRVVAAFRNAEDLCGYLEKHGCSGIDAIVVDANFPSDEWEANNERDISGLIRVSQVIDRYKDKCPFILYTGRRDLVSEGAFKYFFNNNYIVMKGESTSLLVDKIKEVVALQASTEWVVRTKYGAVLDICSKFDAKCAAQSRVLVTKLLAGILENRIEDKQIYFNQLRQEVFEKMHKGFEKQKICPPGLQLNQFKDYLIGNLKGYGNRNHTEALKEELQYVIKTIQDGSHDASNAKLGVSNYVKETSNCMMLHSVVFGTIDILVWAVGYLNKHTDLEENVDFWERNLRN